MIIIIVRPFTYDSDAHIVSGRKAMIRIENLSPQLTAEECMEQRRCIEEGLFEIFIKLDIENPIIRINTAFKGCSSLEKISVLPRIYHN